MYYDAELDFLRRAMKKMRVQSVVLHPTDVPDENLDFGLRKFLGYDNEYVENFRKALDFVEENNIYKLTDAYFCNYVFLVLPGTGQGSSLLLGPYISFEMDKQRLMEEAERFGIPASQLRQLESYYMHIPVISDDSVIFMMVNTLAETLWGEGNAYRIIDLNQDNLVIQPVPRQSQESDDILLHMKLMETRYAYENELMENVSKGLVHRAEMMLSGSSQRNFEQRMSDPLRNHKNYCIICNTLMRKAAEKGGVHPMHLDSISSDFARKIELINSLKAGQDMMAEMVHSYCRLVRRYRMKDYSPLVRKTITYIEAELAADLSLASLAAIHNVNPSYLSSLFHKETGKTLGQFINDSRMEHGARLLRTTKLQVQTIAEYCGISDANYFSKLFRKHFEMSPKQFREQQDKIK